jgi:hypothetical protein
VKIRSRRAAILVLCVSLAVQLGAAPARPSTSFFGRVAAWIHGKVALHHRVSPPLPVAPPDDDSATTTSGKRVVPRTP